MRDWKSLLKKLGFTEGEAAVCTSRSQLSPTKNKLACGRWVDQETNDEKRPAQIH